MQSTAATEPDSKNSNNHNLVACLALYQHRQDQAIGIGWMSGRVRGLLWYYDRLQLEQMTDYLTAAFLNGVIQQGAAEIKGLVKEAEEAEDKHAIAARVIALQEKVEAAKTELDKIT